MTWSIDRGEALAWLRALPSRSADALITDPPYSSGGAFRSDRTARTGDKYVQTTTQDTDEDFTGDNRDQRSFLTWMTLWLDEATRVLRPGSPVCLFTDWRQLPTMSDALQAGGLVWRGVFVWDKVHPRPSMGRFANPAEYVVWGSLGPMPLREDVGCLPGIVSHRAKSSDRHHQTGKPVEVMRALVRVCPPGGLVLDPFAGSASTGVAALLEGRDFAGVEKSEHYHAIAKKRLQAAEAGVVITRDDTRPGTRQGGLFGGTDDA